MSALDMQDIRKTYGSGEAEVVALDHASLTVHDDELVALVGPSGSGKTTLLSIAGGLLSPTGGSVVVGAAPHLRLRPRAAHAVPAGLRRVRLPGAPTSCRS